jgi:hypothetical protein
MSTDDTCSFPNNKCTIDVINGLACFLTYLSFGKQEPSHSLRVCLVVESSRMLWNHSMVRTNSCVWLWSRNGTKWLLKSGYRPNISAMQRFNQIGGIWWNRSLVTTLTESTEKIIGLYSHPAQPNPPPHCRRTNRKLDGGGNQVRWQLSDE